MMNGQVVIVTGATAGIGEVTAYELAARGADVVLISRNATKLANTMNKIKSETGNENISTIQADLSSLAEIRAAGETFLSMYNRLDVLVNNAGAVFSERKESVDGNEMTNALNHLNYFLLTHVLLDQLKATAAEVGEARIINVSSNAHRGAQINFDDFNYEQSYPPFRPYSNSKLMNIMFTYELARRLEGTGVTVNALHPGFVRTNFGDGTFPPLSFLFNTMKNLFAISPQEGAETSIYLASSPEVTGINGKYWVEKQQKRSSKASYDVEAQRRLWHISEDLTGVTYEGGTTETEDAATV